jgi:hypothetical protein
VRRFHSYFLLNQFSSCRQSYDSDPPFECDDQYWPSEVSDPSAAWVQPPSQPSFMTFWVQYTRLAELLGFALRTLYTTKKSKQILGLVGVDKELKTVAELDSVLNRWLDHIPDHCALLAITFCLTSLFILV